MRWVIRLARFDSRVRAALRRVPMLIAAFAYWSVGMPLGAVLGLGLDGRVQAQGPVGMWIGLIAGLTVAALLLGLRFLRISRRIPIVRG